MWKWFCQFYFHLKQALTIHQQSVNHSINVISFLMVLTLKLEVVEVFFFEVLILVYVILSLNFLGLKGVIICLITSSIIFLKTLLGEFFPINELGQTIVVEFGSFFKFFVTDASNFMFTIDYISYNFILLTSLIAFFVLGYSFSYMRNEPKIILFVVLLKSFVLSMILLLLAGNWVVLILGWELIGITSFLLINFWNSKITTLKSTFKAFSFNKVSDCCLIISFLLHQYFNLGHFLNIDNSVLLSQNINIHIFNVQFNYTDLFLYFLIISSFCKSAQFPFHMWLPDSMEAPVPASALIHSATLVSAGIYLMLRVNELLLNSNLLSTFMVLTSFTAFYGALISSYQTDIKKILAYSTISHCGFLMFSISLDNHFITLFYLFGHGFYKSLSFMCAGNIIQLNDNYQDLRRGGNLSQKNPFEFFFLTVCLFNLSSFPFFINFFAKHFLFNQINCNLYLNSLIYVNLYLAAFSGVFYSIRIFTYTFFGLTKSNTSFNKYFELNFSDFMYWPKNIHWWGKLLKKPELFKKFIKFEGGELLNSLLFTFKKSNWLSLCSMFGLFLSSCLIQVYFLKLLLLNSSVLLDSASLIWVFETKINFVFLQIIFLNTVLLFLINFFIYNTKYSYYPYFLTFLTLINLVI